MIHLKHLKLLNFLAIVEQLEARGGGVAPPQCLSIF